MKLNILSKTGSLCFLFCICICNFVDAQNLPLHLIQLPPGFKIELYADNIPNARSLTLSPGGTLFIGNRKEDKVYAVVDADNDQRADQTYIIASGLRSPNGVAFKNGSLYVAEIHRILRFDAIESSLSDPPKPKIVNNTYPAKGWHGWKFIRFGPDGKLYVPIGAPCNVCKKKDLRFGTITRLDYDGSDFEIYARGIRNSVGFDWHPQTQELWFTDNGRDMLGDDIPPDELNHAPQVGMHFGFPYCHGTAIADPEFGKEYSCDQFTPAAQELGPHVASLGMRFYTGSMFPDEYKNQIFIAEHGSWNRSKKIGYRVTLVTLEDNKPVNYQVFAEGWKQGEAVWGRPVDVLVMPDGALLVSDDYAGAIYRISYEETNKQNDISKVK